MNLIITEGHHHFVNHLLDRKMSVNSVTSNANGNFSLISAVMEVISFMLCFSILFNYLTNCFSSAGFLRRWRVQRWIGVDIACKSVSAVFAVMASSAGIFIILYGADYPAQTEKTVLKHIFLICIAYFLYDLYAMFKVWSHYLIFSGCS